MYIEGFGLGPDLAQMVTSLVVRNQCQLPHGMCCISINVWTGVPRHGKQQTKKQQTGKETCSLKRFEGLGLNCQILSLHKEPGRLKAPWFTSREWPTQCMVWPKCLVEYSAS